jgi:extracellular matrix regulatory protein B
LFLKGDGVIMFLHLGGDFSLPTKSVVGIFDLESSTISKATRDFLRISEEEGFVFAISEDLPKSFVIAEIEKKSRVFLSPISSVTLKKRIGFLGT